MSDIRTTDDDVDLLVVEVDDLRLGIAADEVVEMHRMVHVTGLPHTPDVIEGVIDVHGAMVAVVDLRRRLDRPARPPVLTDHLVEVEVHGRRLALHVDRATEVRRVPVAQIDAAPPPEIPYAAGLASVDDGLVVIHDIAAFLTADEALQLDRALRSDVVPGMVP